MNAITATHPTFGKITRIGKAAARKAFDAGKEILLVPCNFYPVGGWVNPCPISKAEHEGLNYFDAIVRDFEWYNCPNSETGTYAAFYIGK